MLNSSNKKSRSYLIIKRLIAVRLCVFIACFSFTQSVLADDWLYTVRKGETLWGLCEKYTNVKDCWLKIGEYNGVTFPRIMPPGTRIRFPVAWLKLAPIPVELTFIHGVVEVKKKSGETLQAAIGDKVFMGDSVITADESSATLLFADGSVSVLNANSRIIMDLLSVNNATAIVDSRIVLERGNVSTKVPKYIAIDDDSSQKEPDPTGINKGDQPHSRVKVKNTLIKNNTATQRRSRFQITTPSAVAAVRGTDFSVSANESGDEMRSAVYSGEIVISKEVVISKGANLSSKNTGDESLAQQSLPVGFGLFVKKNEPLPKPVALLPAPTFEPKPKLRALPLSMSWDEVKGAKAYTLSVYSGELSDQLLVTQTVLEQQWMSSMLEEGCYTVAVRAIDSNDLVGYAVSTDVCVATKPAAPVITFDPLMQQISWSNIENTQGYRVEFSNSSSFRKITDTMVLEPQAQDSADKVNVINLADSAVPSASFIRIVPVHPSGLDGELSSVIEIKKRNRPWIAGFFTLLIVLVGL